MITIVLEHCGVNAIHLCFSEQCNAICRIKILIPLVSITQSIIPSLDIPEIHPVLVIHISIQDACGQ